MRIAWDVSEESVDSVDEFDEVLTHVLRLDFPHGNSPVISVYADDDRWPALEVGITGDRAFLCWTAEQLYAYDRTDQPSDPAVFYRDPNRADIIQPRCLRLSRGAALAALHEYIQTPGQPSQVSWQR